MMADGQLFSNNAEGGTQGTVPSSSNSGGASGDAMTISVGSGNTAIFDAGAAAHGSLGYKWTFGATTSGFMQWAITGSGRVVYRFYLNLPTLPTVQTYLASVRNSTGNMVTIGATAAGKLTLQNAAGTFLFTGASALPTATKLRVEVAVTPGTTTSNGRAELAYYLGDSSTPIEAAYDSGATVNVGTTAAAFARAGEITVGHAGEVDYDDLTAWNLATGWIGPVAATTVYTRFMLLAGVWTPQTVTLL